MLDLITALFPLLLFLEQNKRLRKVFGPLIGTTCLRMEFDIFPIVVFAVEGFLANFQVMLRPSEFACFISIVLVAGWRTYCRGLLT